MEESSPIEIGDLSSVDKKEMRIEYPKSPSIPSLTSAVMMMLNRMPDADTPRDFEDEQWPSEDHCLSLLAKQINGVRRGQHRGLGMGKLSLLFAHACVRLPRPQQNGEQPAAGSDLRSLAQLGSLPFHSLDISFKAKGLGAASFIEFPTSIAGATEKEPRCTSPLSPKSVSAREASMRSKREGAFHQNAKLFLRCPRPIIVSG